MVVAVHTHPFEDINLGLGYFFTQVVTKIAVPFFFAVAGYFYIRKLLDGQKIFVPYLKSLITVYTLWSLIYFAVQFMNDIVLDRESIYVFVQTCLRNYFIKGSWYHFWFFPALIFSVCFVTLFYKLKLFRYLMPITVLLYLIGLLGCSYYGIGKYIPFLSELFGHTVFDIIRRIFFMGIPFFNCGYILIKLEEKNLSLKKAKIYTVVCLVLFFVEMLFVFMFSLHRDMVITVVLYPMLCFIIYLLIKHPLPEYADFAAKSRFVANFIYYSHPLFMTTLFTVPKIIFEISIPQTLQFLIIALITLFFGLLLYRFRNNGIIKCFIK